MKAGVSETSQKLFLDMVANGFDPTLVYNTAKTNRIVECELLPPLRCYYREITIKTGMIISMISVI